MKKVLKGWINPDRIYGWVDGWYPTHFHLPRLYKRNIGTECGGKRGNRYKKVKITIEELEVL